MKLSQKQKAELEVIKWFIPSWVEFEPITNEDIEKFFAWSDKGKPYDLKPNTNDGLTALHYGKQYRELHITEWRDCIKEGLIPKWQLLNEAREELSPEGYKWIENALRGSVPKEGTYDFWRAMGRGIK